MKKLLVIFYVFIISISLNAIEVFGNQSGVWSPDNNPYNMIGEITVPAGETLEIQAGVELIAMGNYRITALGNILSIGTQNDSIRFHGNNGLNWGGVRLENETVQSIFDYCRISDTDDTNDYGIHSINSPVLINHSFFDDHQKAISFSALSATTPSYMEIKNSKIANVQKSGITIVDNSNVLIDSCEVTQCGLGPSFYGAIQLSLQSNSSDCSPTISNSYIHHNGKQGITMGNLFNYDEMAPTVEYNEISYNYTGVYLYNAKGYYAHNHIHHNFVENNPDSGAGVMLYGPGANGTFTYNEVTGNYTGFYLASNATANLGDLENASTDDDGYNCIYDNIFYTGEEYSVYNASAMDVKAENTVWDTDPPIDVTIIDGNDNPAYGIVDYEPTLSPLAPPADFYLTINGVMLYFGGQSYPTYANLLTYYLYIDGVFVGEIISTFFIIPGLVPGQTYEIGVSAVYEEGESVIVTAELYIPHILNPPQNPEVTVDEYAIFTWDPPEPGSTSPPDPLGHYSVFLDGCFEGVTNEQTWTFTDLVYGQTYLAEVCANYEAGSSELIGVEFICPSILNPPLNVVFNYIIGIVFWEPPEDSNATLIGYNIYLDGVFYETVGIDVFEYQYTGLVSGQEYTAGVSAVYEEGESEIIEVGCWVLHICNPPTNASYEILEDHIHLTWQEPEPGSTYPFLNYRIYLDGELFETTELSYDIYDLVIGQTYLVGLTAFYEYLFESNPIEFEIMFVGADDVLTLETKLLGNYPNPFNPTTTIKFTTESTEKNSELTIYNIKGKKIRQYSIFPEQSQAPYGAGNNQSSIIWDGKDENGKEVSSGIYLYKLRTNHHTFTRKMLLIK